MFKYRSIISLFYLQTKLSINITINNYEFLLQLQQKNFSQLLAAKPSSIYISTINFSLFLLIIYTHVLVLITIVHILLKMSLIFDYNIWRIFGNHKYFSIICKFDCSHHKNLELVSCTYRLQNCH